MYLVDDSGFPLKTSQAAAPAGNLTCIFYLCISYQLELQINMIVQT